jgi:hypothetical protein
MRRFLRTVLVLALSLAFPMGLTAQEEHGVEHSAESKEDGEHGEAHGHHKNHVAFFLGSTQAELHHGERDDPQFTLGVDYERRLNEYVGVGALLDAVVEGHREVIIGIPLFLHAGSLKGLIAPGGERVRETGNWEFMTRFGILWEFEISSSWSLAPVVQYDVTEEGGTWVLGLGFGKGF